ncbi:hypothetical protein TIFTF001_016450 [Ficus carica]|uniref:Uncharacterized protein n=1 Tax=Ficus carica TaxID=3494 RepID=A0AA88ATC2_FICCA|nr:hypothetical protein TIFTF001_016450 [Ficus carica]
MKIAPSSTGFYYFQGYQGTFITSCPDSDKSYKHLWFFARRGGGAQMVVWSVGLCPEKANPEWNQNRLLSNESLAKYNWFGSSSTSGYPHDQSRPGRPEEVTVAAGMLDPGVPVASTSGLQSGSSSPGTWGLRIADEDMEGNQAWPSRDSANDRTTRKGLLGCSRSSLKAMMEAGAIRAARALLQLAESLLTLM